MDKDDFGFADFMASTVHDMKNSLMMQVNSLEIIASQCQRSGDVETAHSLGAIIFDASRMNSSLIQLLSLYKFDCSVYPLDINEQNIADILQQAVLQDKSSQQFKGIAVTIECDPDLQWYVDRDLLTGIVINALNNAYHYTTDKVRIVASLAVSQLEVRVEDNGSGYPAHMLDKNQLSDARAVHFSSGSTGLGFHFASRAAKMHKNGTLRGSLSIENGGLWGGGCFVVRLP
jgi:K+-sensing histidine kinase KdpD